MKANGFGGCVGSHKCVDNKGEVRVVGGNSVVDNKTCITRKAIAKVAQSDVDVKKSIGASLWVLGVDLLQTAIGGVDFVG